VNRDDGKDGKNLNMISTITSIIAVVLGVYFKSIKETFDAIKDVETSLSTSLIALNVSRVKKKLVRRKP
jgi:hypothetical protein